MSRYPKPSRTAWIYLSASGWMCIVLASLVGGAGFLTLAMAAFILARIELSDLRREDQPWIK